MPRLSRVLEQSKDGSWAVVKEYRAPWWVPAFHFDSWVRLAMSRDFFKESERWAAKQMEDPVREGGRDS